MTILLLAFLIFIPLLAGYPVRKILEPGTKGMLDTGILGVLTLLVTSGSLQLLLLLLKRPFSDYEKIYPLLLLLLALTGSVLLVLDLRSGKTKQKTWERLKGFCRSWGQNRESLIFSIAVLVLLLLCVTRILTETPDISDDFTLETMKTTLSTDTIYQYNSLTGMVIEEGMPIRQQILTLPFFLAFLSDIFHVDAAALLYKIFPCYVLVLALLVYGRWASFLFQKQRERQSGFLMLVSLLILVGDYAGMAPASLMLHQGFTGNALCAGVVIPFAICLCMQKRWIMALGCVGAELFLVWTTYGFGYSVLVMVFFGLLSVSDKVKKKLAQHRAAEKK